MPLPRRLPRSFFIRPPTEVARALLGQRLVRLDPSGVRLDGFILETEAYDGPEDLGAHARAGRTQRNASIWGPPGHAYVYFTYGMHWMLNAVCNPEGLAGAVLLRSIWPAEGLGTLRARRPGRTDRELANGPAKLCRALGVDGCLDGHDLCGPDSSLFVEEGILVADSEVLEGPRVGLNRVPEPWKSVPWRFWITPGRLEAASHKP